MVHLHTIFFAILAIFVTHAVAFEFNVVDNLSVRDWTDGLAFERRDPFHSYTPRSIVLKTLTTREIVNEVEGRISRRSATRFTAKYLEQNIKRGTTWIVAMTSADQGRLKKFITSAKALPVAKRMMPKPMVDKELQAVKAIQAKLQTKVEAAKSNQNITPAGIKPDAGGNAEAPKGNPNTSADKTKGGIGTKVDTSKVNNNSVPQGSKGGLVGGKANGQMKAA